MFVAHYRSISKEEQSVREHLLGAQRLAESYGSKLNVAHIAGLAALLHDLGKFSEDFQIYLKQAVYKEENPIYKRVRSTMLRLEGSYCMNCITRKAVHLMKNYLLRLLVMLLFLTTVIFMILSHQSMSLIF